MIILLKLFIIFSDEPFTEKYYLNVESNKGLSLDWLFESA